MNRTYRAASIAVLLGLATLLLIPACAAAQAGTGSLELYAGEYFPDQALDNSLTYGVRGAYHWTDSLASEVTVGRLSPSLDFAPGAGIDVHITLVDLSTAWTFNPGHRAEVSLFAGPGWSFFDANAHVGNVTVDSASGDSFTLHAGVGLRIHLSDRVYLRPDVRARWFEKADNSVDYEASLGLGFRLGG